MQKITTLMASMGLLLTAACSGENCPVELVVLGIGQDAGAPQIGNPDDAAWKDPSKRLWATSLALIDHENGKRYLFEATPDIRDQMQMLDKIAPPNPDGPYIDGVFLTHAHIGHYAGLMFLGRESMGAEGVPVHVMPRMGEFLASNGPWSQLVELGNIKLEALEAPIEFDEPTSLSETISVIEVPVPHRDEYSETVGFIIRGPQKSTFFLPDIDGWEEWESLSGDDWIIHTDDVVIRDVVKQIDYALLDATFYDDNELPGRDMSQIPHPRVTESMDLMDASGGENLKDKIRFIHINHTNPLRDKTSAATREIDKRGYKLAHRGERFCL